MPLSRYVFTTAVTLVPDTAATVVAGEPGTGGAAGFGSAQSVSSATAGKFSTWAMSYQEGQAIYLDPAGALYAAIIAVNASALLAWRDGTDNVSHAALSN